MNQLRKKEYRVYFRKKFLKELKSLDLPYKEQKKVEQILENLSNGQFKELDLKFIGRKKEDEGEKNFIFTKFLRIRLGVYRIVLSISDQKIVLIKNIS